MLLHGDCLEVLPTLGADSIDACVTDPPYHLTEVALFRSHGESIPLGAPRTEAHKEYRRTATKGFMGKSWDGGDIAQDPEMWAAVLRVLKPGAHLLACGGTRTYHRMASAVEDAGFEIRDCLAWLYGSGFPKSLNLGEGLGTALKPAYEPIVLARKPFKGSVKANVEQFGTGALNIDACRIEGVPPITVHGVSSRQGEVYGKYRDEPQPFVPNDLGRWPANVCLDEIAALVLDEQSGELHSKEGDYIGPQTSWSPSGTGRALVDKNAHRHTDPGGASRFYYVAKPSREERDYGCSGLAARSAGECTDRQEGSAGLNNPRAGAGRTGGGRNFHPTVKPVELMRWLVRLVTPINGTVLDPFTGSGTTGMACRYEQRHFIGIEREAEYVDIAERRIAAVAPLFNEREQTVVIDAESEK